MTGMLGDDAADETGPDLTALVLAVTPQGSKLALPAGLMSTTASVLSVIDGSVYDDSNIGSTAAGTFNAKALSDFCWVVCEFQLRRLASR